MLNMYVILANIAIAGFVGGVTNHLAIKMLFHPRKEWRVMGARVPFTPGLIPKRKEEIGRSLGHVVGEYLVTSHGLISTLQKPEMKTRLEQFLRRFMIEWTSKETTLQEELSQWLGQERIEDVKARLAVWLRDKTGQGVEWLWMEKGIGDIQLSMLIPDWSDEKREEWIEWAVGLLIDEIKKELHSVNGERMLRQMTSQFVGQAGGFLGALAGMFMDESKTVEKIRAALFQQLDSANVKTTFSTFIRKKIHQFEHMSLSTLLEMVAKQDSLAFLQEKARQLLPWEAWLHHLGEIRFSDALGPYQDRLLDYSSEASERVLSMITRNVEPIMNSIELPKLVEEQVSHFPIERLEEIILSVSGKEFRAITWLGVLLGGIIGLIQSLLLPLLGQI